MPVTGPRKADTGEMAIPRFPRRDRAESFSARVQVDVSGLSNQGKIRSNNEDHFLVCRFGRFMEMLQSNLPSGDLPGKEEETGYGLVVADGVGGCVAGEQASRLAITILVNLVLHTPDWIFRLDDAGFSQEDL